MSEQSSVIWNWRKFFLPSVLELGRLDEIADKLVSFDMDPNGHWATGETVGGFQVMVKIPVSASDFMVYPSWNNLYGGRIRPGYRNLHYTNYYSCSCATGKNGTRCRHLANLLIHAEKIHGKFEMQETPEEREARLRRELKAKLQGKKADPWEFFTPRIGPQPHGLTYNPDKILKKTAFETNRYELAIAEKLVDQVSAADIDVSLCFALGGEQGLEAKATIEGKAVAMEVSPKAVTSLTCRCGAAHLKDKGSWYGSYDKTPDTLCAHAMILWLRFRERVIQENPGDMTDYTADRLLSLLSGKAVQQNNTSEDAIQPGKNQDLVLVPRITRDKDDSLKLAFDLGRQGERSYAVRTLEKLVDTAEAEEKYSLGKTAEADFSKETFEETSMKWYRMIVSRVRSIQKVNNDIYRKSNYWHNSPELSAGGGIPLAESDLDIVYDLAEGGTIRYQYGGRQEVDVIPVGEVSPKIIITLDPDQDGDILRSIRMQANMPRMLQGNLHRYILDKNGFGRVTESQVESLQAFHSVANRADGFNCVIGRKKFAEFYYRVLPLLRDSEEVVLEDHVGSLIDSALPPEAEFTFYLDIVGQDIICRVTANYDGKTVTLGFDQDSLPTDPRDRDQESRVIALVRSFFPGTLPEQQAMSTPDSEEHFLRILTEGVSAFNSYGEVRGSDAFHRAKLLPAPQPKFYVRLESGLLDLSIETKDISKQELLDLLDSYRKKKRWFRLKNGDYMDLRDTSALSELEEAVNAMDISMEELISGSIKIPQYRALYLDRLLEEHEDLAASRDRSFKALVRSFQTIRDSDFEVPENLKDVIRPYQQYGFRWLSTLAQSGFGGILADEMGLGKTLQMLAWLQMRKSAGETKPALVICPASLVYNWIEEAERFAPGLKTFALAGRLNERRKAVQGIRDGNGPDLFITSYDLLKRDITLFDGITFSAIILDEAQYIKNSGTIVGKAVRVLNAEHRFALTGTPIENRLSELWSIFDFLMPGFLYSAREFSENFETPIMKKKDQAATDKLARMTAPFILRRKKADVLKELPEKLEKTQRASMEEDQRKLYDAQVLHLKEMLATSSNSGEDKMRVLAEITRLRQLCCDPALMFEDYHGSSAKRAACLELVQNAIDGGHRMLLFSQFTSMLALLAEDLKEAGIPFYTITGATPKQERLQLVNAFNAGDTPVFLISLKAGGTGLNLTGADVVIHYDPWWNLAVQNQATDRAHRIGQTRQVTVVKLIAAGTIEEKIIDLQEAKRELAEAIISGETGSLMSLSREELLALLN